MRSQFVKTICTYYRKKLFRQGKLFFSYYWTWGAYCVSWQTLLFNITAFLDCHVRNVVIEQSLYILRPSPVYTQSVMLRSFHKLLSLLGYLIEATTIIECLHTFCKSCIVRYLDDENKCPECQLQIHQSHPLSYIMLDRKMQVFVMRLLNVFYFVLIAFLPAHDIKEYVRLNQSCKSSSLKS